MIIEGNKLETNSPLSLFLSSVRGGYRVVADQFVFQCISQNSYEPVI